MPVKPPAPRHKTEEFGDKLVISMPSLKVWPFIVILVMWSFFWVLAGAILLAASFATLRNSDSPDMLLAIIYLVLWSALGVPLLYNTAWQLFGIEEVQVTNISISISRVVFGIRRSKEYMAEHISGLELARLNMRDMMRQPNFWASNAGSISFDYGARTFRFGGTLDDAEAKQIILEIQQKFPQYRRDSISRS